MKNKSGIYKIMNKINGKIYIGSAINFKQRWYGNGSHVKTLNKNKHKNMYLQNAWNKYGEDSFEFLIVEECPEDKLIEREQYYLDTLKPWKREIGYNICKIAGNLLGYKHSEEAKQKISLIHKGKNISEKMKNKLREQNVGELSPKAKYNWNLINELRQKYKEGCGIKELAKQYNMYRTTIQTIIENKDYEL
jgi:group I intron endonuclease